MRKKPLPKFESEAEEARWHFEHDNEADAYFSKANTAEVSDLVSRLPSREVATEQARAAREKYAPAEVFTGIQLSPDEFMAAKEIASRKGLTYQDWLDSVIRRAIAEELGA